MKDFKDYLNLGIVKRVSVNKSKADDLINGSERNKKYLGEVIDKIGIVELNSNNIIDLCYDILMGLIRAKMYLEGYKCFGTGAHEAEISYLILLGFSISEVRFMDDIRNSRNGIKYYGRKFDIDYAKETVKFTNSIYIKLKKLADK